jgi:uncharacterized membrane protein YedE/YeeE
MDAQIQSAIFAFGMALVGCISTFFILAKRGHLSMWFAILTLIIWPLALLISLCIPVKKDEFPGEKD